MSKPFGLAQSSNFDEICERNHFEKIAELVTNDAHSVSAAARSRYLDGITRKHFGLPVEDENKVTCYGDARRANMQIGPTPRLIHANYDRESKERNAQNDALKEAVAAILHTLPDLVTIGELLGILPADAVEPINPTRRPMALSIALRELGVQQFMRTSPLNGRARFYLVRNRRKYAAMSTTKLIAAKMAMDAGRPVAAAPVRRKRPNTAAGRKANSGHANSGARPFNARGQGHRRLTAGGRRPPLCARKLLG
jgi:hypothetical protein